MKIKGVSQRVQDNGTLRSQVGSVSFGISSNMTQSRDHVVIVDAGHVKEKVVD